MEYFFICIKLGLLLSTLTSFGQTQKSSAKRNYSIESKLKKQFQEFKKSFNEEGFSETGFQILKGDSVISNNNGIPNNFREGTNIENLKGDTINIQVYTSDATTAYGYRISISKDSCIVWHFIQSSVRTYSLLESDSPRHFIWLPCKTFNLKLSSEPEFKKEEVIDGIVELVSEDYFVIENQKKEKHRTELKSIFRTRPLEWYKAFLKKSK